MTPFDLVLFLPLLPPLPPIQSPLPALDSGARRAIVHDISGALEEAYVFPEVGAAMGEHLRKQLAAGGYEHLDTLPELAKTLTQELFGICRDKHLVVRLAPPPPPGAAGRQASPEELQAQRRAQLRRQNHGFRKLEILPGNVGYLRLDSFAPAESGGTTAVAALGMLAGSDAVIFDLRENGGGSPSMVQLLSSYLVGPLPTHLNNFYRRPTDSLEQFWTQAWVPGERMLDVPVFVLTSARTFSAAEEFTYNLKHLQRATIVGETTAGGAHPVSIHRVAGHPLEVSLPTGRAINPITGTNWEGTGIEPHVAVPAGEALEAAHQLALESLDSHLSDPGERAAVAILRDTLAAQRNPVTLSADELVAYGGRFGPREVRVQDGGLEYRRGNAAWLRLVPVGRERFLVRGHERFMIRFERDDAGQVTRLVGLYDDGREEPSERAR